MPASLSPGAALEELLGHEAWAVIRLRESPTVTLVGGALDRLEKLGDIPLEEGVPADGRRFDRLVAVPFRQVTERGFVAHDDGAPLAVVTIQTEREVPLAALIEALPDEEVAFEDAGGFDTSDEDYAEVVAQIIRDEIGNGEGANLVVGRHYRAQLRDWDATKALTVLRRLLTSERGAYWTYCFWTGDRFLIGASPERHVSVHGGDVRMNPISGTFRLRGPATGPTPGGAIAEPDLKARLLEFLADEKEIFELFMVVDEELKMMCDICHEGGQVLGPFLKPMTHLVHTEYLLAGRTRSDVRDVLRDTMFAATVTGAPVENACRLIHDYESEGRGYYAGALALIGRDEQGAPTADSPIVIRTADVSPEGAMKVTAGATLVRDSEPDHEVAETLAKAGGILSAFGLVPGAPGVPADIAELTQDEDVLIALNSRNQRLAKFWLTDQAGAPPAPSLAGRTIAILHGEDDFVNMLAHVFSVLGMGSRVVRHEAFLEQGAAGAFDDVDRLGIDLDFKDIVFQGTQSSIGIDGREERVGFYNTFVGRLGENDLPDGVRVESDPETGDIHVISGPTYRGVQFHAESILTENGFALLRQLLLELLG
jgi:phenazine biosynthesis protein phzE